MATIENNGLMIYLDSSGNKNILYPITKTELVDGLDTEIIEDSTYSGCFYRMNGGVQEWFNPPMVLGADPYRTTERYNGKPVYVKLVDVGTMPNDSVKIEEHKCPNIKDIVSISGSAKTSSGSVVALPSATGYSYDPDDYGLGLSWAIGATEKNVYVVTNANRSSWTGSILLKFTKTTD